MATAEAQTLDIVPVSSESRHVAVQHGANDFMPVFDISTALARRQAMIDFTAAILHKDTDFGVIPGTPKPTLLKPGAEKLVTFFGLTPRYIPESVVEDATGAEHGGEPFYAYRYTCQLWKGDRLLGESSGYASTWESKYRYRWVQEHHLPESMRARKATLRSKTSTVSELDFAVKQGKTDGQYGKPAEYWDRFRKAITEGRAKKIRKEFRNGGSGDAWEITSVAYQIPNPEVHDQANTALKMAQKRALIAAVLVTTNASELYTQDLDPDDDKGDGNNEPPPPAETSEQARDRRIAEEAAKPGSNRSNEEPPPHDPNDPANWPDHMLDKEPVKTSAPKPAQQVGEAIVGTLTELHKRLSEAKTAIGEAAYYEILGTFNLENSGQIRSLKIGNEVLEKMKKHYRDVTYPEIQRQRQREAEEAGNQGGQE